MTIIKRVRANSAFTLIELLVVVSIIGMLSSVVLVSLQSARDKGRVGAGIKFATYNYRAFGADAIAMYDFNTGSGSAVVNDLSANNLTLSLYSGATRSVSNPDPVSNSSGNYLKLTGSASYARTAALPTALQQKSIRNFTTSAWVNLNIHNTTADVGIAEIYSSVGHLTSLYIRSSGSYGGRHGSCIYNGTAASALQMGKWQHVATTYDGSKISLYVDGTFVDSTNCASISLLPTGAYLYVGRYQNAYNIDGSVDDVAIYTQSLTASEVQRLYAQGAAAHGIAINE